LSGVEYVDPHRSPGLFRRAYAALANTRLGSFLSVHLVWKLDPYLNREIPIVQLTPREPGS
jgi:hypothetical protein